MDNSAHFGCAKQIIFHHCSRAWSPKPIVNPARVLRGPRASLEHKDPKAQWELKATLAEVEIPGTQGLLECTVL